MEKSDEVQQSNKAVQEKDDLVVDDAGENRGEFHNLVDILFVIDATGSMSWCMSQMKKTIKKIISKFAQKQYNIKFAIELYRDHPPQEYSFVEKHFDLRNEDAILEVVDKECDVAGGGDTPEAVMDGLAQGLKKTSWRVSSDSKTQSKRFLFHGCDAPPHGQEYGSTSTDPEWRKNGCPCKITRHDIKTLLHTKQVDYTLIKCGREADVMESLFKECFQGRFKRVVEIKKEGHKRGRKRQASVSDSGSESCSEEQDGDSLDHDEGLQRRPYPVDELDIIESTKVRRSQKAVVPKKKHKGFFSSLKDKLFGSSELKEDHALKQCEEKMECEEKAPARKRMKKEKKKKVKKAKKEEDEDEDSGGSGQLNRSRSMASLVLSEVESGVDEYFGDDIKKDKKKKRRGSLDKQQAKEEVTGEVKDVLKPENTKIESVEVQKEVMIETVSKEHQK